MICPHLKFGNQGNTKVEADQVVMAIIYRLKTGCQWRELPMRQFFDHPYSWKSVYHHFQKWSKDGSWEKLWQQLLSNHKHLLDMSNIQLGGTHTIAKRGGTAVDYQGRKKHKTTNMLLITDARGIPLCCSQPKAGNHHDAYKLVPTVRSMLSFLKQCTIRIDGLFLNADSGFDTAPFRTYCEQNDIIGNIIPNDRNGTKRTAIFDTLLNKNRFVIERTNAWMDAYKALLIRYETNKLHWKAFNLIALCLIFIKQL